MQDVLAAELARLGHRGVVPTRHGLRLSTDGEVAALLRLRSCTAVWRRLHFEVPRPRALLGDEHVRRLGAVVAETVRTGDFTGVRIVAAGAESSVMRRLGEVVAQHAGLPFAPEEGDLVLRIVPAESGWDVGVRLTPRPLSTRGWRLHDLPGALNATIAAAMVEWLQPRPGERFCNLLCGSGTLLVERLLRQRTQAIGVDRDAAALRMAADHAAAAGVHVTLLQADARALPLRTGSIDVLCADLPYGNRMGSRAGNAELYTAVLSEAARVAVPSARAAFITLDVRRFERVLGGQPHWSVEAVHAVEQRGQHPRVWVLSTR